MGDAYQILKLKLEELGYNHALPEEAIPLVECVLADLLQTTRSLQNYMDLSKEALMQRDSLMLEAEPYRCENAKLIQENNRLHKQLIELTEENIRFNKESKRKVKLMSEDIMRKDAMITKLQHEVRDLSLRGICADTHSSRLKRRDAGDVAHAPCRPHAYHETVNDTENHISELTKKIQALNERNQEYHDEIMLLKSQVDHRDNEIVRLNILLEGGRPLTAITKDCCKITSESRYQDLIKQIQDLESANHILKKEIEKGLDKQHEAMLRALKLADKNKTLQDEMHKVDALALKVEEDCNKRLETFMNEINVSQTKLDGLTLKHSALARELVTKDKDTTVTQMQDMLNLALNEKETLKKDIRHLQELIKSYQDKLLFINDNKPSNTMESSKYPTKDELQCLLVDERKKYEKHILDIQTKLTETVNVFNKHMVNCNKRDESPRRYTSHDNNFIRDLHKTLCESEQKILMLKKENDELRNKSSMVNINTKQNLKDIISQLNTENAELSKENIALSQELSQYKVSVRSSLKDELLKKEIQKLKDELQQYINEIQILKKDKNEYYCRYKDNLDLVDKLKRDLSLKQKESEQLQEENCSYRMHNRTDKASAGHLSDECKFLREELKRMQTDVIKEKTLTSQIKNIQLETERSNSDMQNEVLLLQKKLNLAKDSNESLEKKCKDYQAEVSALNNEKLNIMETVKKIDQDRDKLVIELDHKTETICVLEKKIQSQTFEISKLEHEIADMRRKLNMHKVSEHKVADSEAQIIFLNGEVLRLTQQYDTAVIENKQLQSTLADANGTLKLVKIEYEKSRKEVDSLKQQLQHYVAEIRRIEELLSNKEAERSDMLEHFASLSVEANILENTNHSLESESASKSLQLQSYISKIQSLESKIMDQDNIIDSQSTRIAAMTCKITALENEIKLMREEKIILEQNVLCLKKMCSSLQCQDHKAKATGDAASEIQCLTNVKAKVQAEKEELFDKLHITEKLLSNARNEIVELKLALQDATAETKSLQDCIRFNRRETDIHEATSTREVFHLPLMSEESVHEVSHEEDQDSSRFYEVRKRLTKYNHGSTL